MNNRKKQTAGGRRTVPGNVSEVTIDDLQSSIAYSVSISASTKAGAGPSSDHLVRGKRKVLNLSYLRIIHIYQHYLKVQLVLGLAL